MVSLISGEKINIPLLTYLFGNPPLSQSPRQYTTLLQRCSIVLHEKRKVEYDITHFQLDNKYISILQMSLSVIVLVQYQVINQFNYI